MREVEGEIDKPSIILGGFNISLSGGEKQADTFSNNIDRSLLELAFVKDELTPDFVYYL